MAINFFRVSRLFACAQGFRDIKWLLNFSNVCIDEIEACSCFFTFVVLALARVGFTGRSPADLGQIKLVTVSNHS